MKRLTRMKRSPSPSLLIRLARDECGSGSSRSQSFSYRSIRQSHRSTAQYYTGSIFEHYYERVVFEIFTQVLLAACVLLVMLWDGAPLGVFGLKKPAWSVDTITAFITFVAHRTLVSMAVSLFVDFLRSCNYTFPTPHPFFHIREPEHSWTGVALLFILSVTVGFTEELAMRGYLIPRLERLANSKFWAVLISAALFGCIHLQNGIVSVWSAFWAGVLYGIVFVWTRRLWPTVFTHAAYDFVAFLSRA